MSGRYMWVSRLGSFVVVAGLALGATVWPALCTAQPNVTEEPAEEQDENAPYPEPSPSATVLTLLSQDYLVDEERAVISVRHGVWTDEHLTSPRLIAEAALTRGAYNDPVFEDPQVPVELRAQAALRRGNPEQAVQILDGVESPTAILTRGRALIDLGKQDEAKAALKPMLESMVSGTVTDADTMVECIRAAILLLRIDGPSGEAGQEYHGFMQALGEVRTKIDPLSFSAPLAESMLLFSKWNFPEAGKALEESMKLNPRNVEAWAHLGAIMVASFDVERARRVAVRLEMLTAPQISIEAAELRAAIALRLSDWAGARAAVSPALTVFPTHRGLLAMEAAAVAGTFDESQVRAKLKAFDQLAPGSPQALHAVGTAMADARQYDEAAMYLNETVERAPRWIDPLIELGLSELQAGRLETSEAALIRASALDTFNVRATNSLTLLQELKGWVSFESPHFVVRCKPGLSEIVAKEMLEPLERVYKRVTGNAPGGIDHEPTRKTTIELYPDHRSFAVRIVGLTGIHTLAAATGPVIAMEASAEGPGHPLGLYDWVRVVQHEFTHTVTLSRTKNRLPHWFTEAGAVYLEDSPRDWSSIQLLKGALQNDALLDMEGVNLAFVRPKRPTDRALAYAQSHWMYEFMIERFGPRSVLDLMDLYATGKSENDAFGEVLKLTQEEFLVEFKVWANEQLASWGVASRGKQTVELFAQAGYSMKSATVEQVDELLTSHPDEPALLALKISLVKPKEGEVLTDEAAAAWKALLLQYAKVCPVDPMPHRILAEMYLQSPVESDQFKAIEHLEYLDAREQSSPALALKLSSLYASQGDFAKAMAKATRATQIAPLSPKNREFAATMALRAKDFQAAERHLRALAAIEPDRQLHKQRLEALEKLKQAPQ